jgi:hypothetical protein
MNASTAIIGSIVLLASFFHASSRLAFAQTTSGNPSAPLSTASDRYGFSKLSFTKIKNESYLGSSVLSDGFKPEQGDRVVFYRGKEKLVEGEYIGLSKSNVAIFLYNNSFFCPNAPSVLQKNYFPPMLTAKLQEAINGKMPPSTEKTSLRSSKTTRKDSGSHCVPLESIADKSLVVELWRNPTKIELVILGPTEPVEVVLQTPKTALDFAESIGAVKSASGQSVEFRIQQKRALDQIEAHMNAQRKQHRVAEGKLSYKSGFAEYATNFFWVDNSTIKLSDDGATIKSCKLVLYQSRTSIVWKNSSAKVEDRALARDYISRLKMRHEDVHLRLGRMIAETATKKYRQRRLTVADLAKAVQEIQASINDANTKFDNDTKNGDSNVQEFHFLMLDEPGRVSLTPVGKFFKD